VAQIFKKKKHFKARVTRNLAIFVVLGVLALIEQQAVWSSLNVGCAGGVFGVSRGPAILKSLKMKRWQPAISCELRPEGPSYLLSHIHQEKVRQTDSTDRHPPGQNYTHLGEKTLTQRGQTHAHTNIYVMLTHLQLSTLSFNMQCYLLSLMVQLQTQFLQDWHGERISHLYSLMLHDAWRVKTSLSFKGSQHGTYTCNSGLYCNLFTQTPRLY
jgi:hypothetical protein